MILTATITTANQSHSLMKLPLSSAFKPKSTWPDPEASIGESFCVLGKYRCWEAIGLAGDIPKSAAFRDIKTLLESRYEYLHEGLSVPRALSYELYMIGKVKKEAQPYIMFICESKPSRQRALKLVRESGILDEYPGVLLGECSRAPILSRPAVPLASLDSGEDLQVTEESDEGDILPESGPYVYYQEPLSDVYGFPIFVEIFGGSPRRKATAGGIIRVGDEFYVLTVAHTFFDPSRREKPNATRPIEFSLELDGESDDDDTEGRDFIEVTSRGSESPESFPSDDSGSLTKVESFASQKRKASPSRSGNSSRASPVSILDDVNAHDFAVLRNRQRLLGSLFMTPHRSTDTSLDWALVSINDGDLLRSLSQPQRAVNIREVAREVSSRIEIKAITASNGTLSGTLFRNPTFMQLPPSATFQELWIVHLDGPLQHGDCGSWIVDNTYQTLYGYITSGDPGSSIAYIIPAYQAFTNIEQRTGHKVKFLCLEDFTKESHLEVYPEIIPSQAELSTENESLFSLQSATEDVLKEGELGTRHPLQGQHHLLSHLRNSAGYLNRFYNPLIPTSRMAGLSLNTNATGSALPPATLTSGGPPVHYHFDSQHHQPLNFPPVNPTDQNPPCNTLYVGNLPINTSEDELKAMFSNQRGFKRLCFRTKQNRPICFVQFEDVSFATKALHELYGHPLPNSVSGGIRLSFSKNPLGVRSGQPVVPPAYFSSQSSVAGPPPPPPPPPTLALNSPPGLGATGISRGSGAVMAPPRSDIGFNRPLFSGSMTAGAASSLPGSSAEAA